MSIRLRQICLVANQLAPVIDDFKDILGLAVCFIDKGVGVFGLENSLMPVGTNFIEVVAPIKENTAARRYLKRRQGDGGYMVICQCDSHETQRTRKARAAAMNIRIAWEHESKSFHGMPKASLREVGSLQVAAVGPARFALTLSRDTRPSNSNPLTHVDSVNAGVASPKSRCAKTRAGGSRCRSKMRAFASSRLLTGAGKDWAG